MSDEGAFAKKLAVFLESLSAREINAIAEGKAEFQVIKVRSVSSKAGDTPSDAIRQALLSELVAAPTREAGRRILVKESLTKAKLQKLARELDQPYRGKDTVSSLIERIIEATTGARLRSEAVQGTEEK